MRLRGGRRACWWAGALLAAALLPLPVLEAAPAGGGAAVLTRLVWPGYRFELRFTHSIFDIPVQEHFAVDWSGRLILREVRSTRADIVDYYFIPGGRVAERPGDVRILDLRQPHRRLIVKASPVGGRSYHDPGCTVPLTTLVGGSNSLELAVRWRPWLPSLRHWRGKSCPSSRSQSVTNR